MATPAFEDIADTFAFLDDWEDRYRHVIELGRAMHMLVTAEGVFARPEETLTDITNALRDRGLATTRRRPSVEWRREFVGGRSAG